MPRRQAAGIPPPTEQAAADSHAADAAQLAHLAAQTAEVTQRLTAGKVGRDRQESFRATHGYLDTLGY
eukprot:5300788-Prymnesium_polylepis.1